jgi:hypothetical protein
MDFRLRSEKILEYMENPASKPENPLEIKPELKKSAQGELF